MTIGDDQIKMLQESIAKANAFLLETQNELRRIEKEKANIASREERIKNLERTNEWQRQQIVELEHKLGERFPTRDDRKAKRLRAENAELALIVKRCGEALRGEGAACRCQMRTGAHESGCLFARVAGHTGTPNRIWPNDLALREMQNQVDRSQHQMLMFYSELMKANKKLAMHREQAVVRVRG
jgi:hypothetical protein